MVGQLCGHRWRSPFPGSIGPLDPKSPDWPTEVVAGHREIGNRLMDLPIFREAVGLVHFPAGAVGAVVTFDEGCVDGLAHLRQGQRGHHGDHDAEVHAVVDLGHAAFFSGFMRGGILQTRRRNFVRFRRPSRFASAFGNDGLSVGLKNLCCIQQDIRR